MTRLQRQLADNSCKLRLRTRLGLLGCSGVVRPGQQVAQRALRMACIGIGGKGASDSDDAARFGDVVAICDIDEQRLESAGERPLRKSETLHAISARCWTRWHRASMPSRSVRRITRTRRRADGDAAGQALFLPEAA